MQSLKKFAQRVLLDDTRNDEEKIDELIEAGLDLEEIVEIALEIDSPR